MGGGVGATSRCACRSGQRVEQLDRDRARNNAGLSLDREVSADPQVDDLIWCEQARAARDQLLTRVKSVYVDAGISRDAESGTQRGSPIGAVVDHVDN